MDVDNKIKEKMEYFDDFSTEFSSFININLNGLIIDSITAGDSEPVDDGMCVSDISEENKLIINGSVLHNLIASHLIQARLSDELFLTAYTISKNTEVEGGLYV